MQYAEVKDNKVVKVGSRPKWLIGGATPEESRPLTDEELMEHGWYPVLPAPSYNPDTEKLEPLRQEYWPVLENGVGPQFAVVSLSSNEQNDNAITKAITEHQNALEGIMAERQRRLALGFDYNFNDTRGIHRFGTTDADMKSWDEVSKGSQAAIAVGKPTKELFVVTETGPVTITAYEWQQILEYATDVRQPIFLASFRLASMETIPEDYTDDIHWT